MAWGTLGSVETLEGASGRSWTLRFERRLAPRENAKNPNPASSVWLVRDEKSARLFAAKRQTLASPAEVDALVDEAAAWRSACLADSEKHVVELIDVFVDRDAPYAVTFLAELCSRGVLPKTRLSEPVLLTIAADLARASAAIPNPHAHISHESLLVDETGRIRLAGFGAHRSAILRDNPGLTPSDDAFDIGLLLYELMFGAPPPESLQLPETSAYSSKLTDLVSMAFSHPHPNELFDRAVSSGAEPQAPVVDVAKTEQAAPPVAEHVSRATDRNVDRLVQGVDIAPAFAALLNDLNADPDAVGNEIYSMLFQKPVGKDPLCAMRALTMLHNLILDGPDSILAATRKNDKFLGWAESSWSREAVETGQNADEPHPATVCFAGGELAFYAAFLRRKAKFHLLAAGAFSGRWDRTGVVDSAGKDVLVTRRRKIVGGMADIIEMASELGCRFAQAVDQEAPVKQHSLGALVSECCLAYNAALEISEGVQTVRDSEKLAPGIGRLYSAARILVFAVEHVPSAGGEHWVEQFAKETPPDIIADAHARERASLGMDESGEFPKEGWAEAEAIVDDEAEEKRRKKKEKKKKRKEAKEEAERKKNEEEAKAKEELTAADGALVVHGADDAAAKVHTMFGDLLAINDENGNREEVEKNEQGALPSMSNAQALASAFGVPEESVGGQFAALPPVDHYGEDGEDEGGYEDYKARQEYNGAEQARLRKASNTAAWAAQAGYGETALVVREKSSQKSHPAFCQCALCLQEEAQAAAALKAASGVRGRESNAYADGYDDKYQPEVPREENGPNPLQSGALGAGNRTSYIRKNYADSLDSKESDQYAPEGRREANKSYYQDDYDSYESVTYSVDDDHASAQKKDGASSQPVWGNESHSSLPMEELVIEKKKVLNLKKLRPGDKISESEFVSVSKGEYNREAVVIKRLTKAGLSSQSAIEEFEHEVGVMCSLSHPRLLNCIAASIQKPNCIFVTEHMKRGTVFDILHKNRIKLTWALIRKIALQIAEAMTYLHGQGILHCDLKSLNVFVDGSYNIKIGDFGLSRRMNAPQSSGLSGTYQYMAPEVLQGEPHSEKSDVFSYAHLLCEMVSGSAPFEGMDPREVAERVVNEDIRPQMPPHCQRAYVNLIQMCWGRVPSTRPSFPEIVELINNTTK